MGKSCICAYIIYTSPKGNILDLYIDMYIFDIHICVYMCAQIDKNTYISTIYRTLLFSPLENIIVTLK